LSPSLESNGLRVLKDEGAKKSY